MKSIMDQIYRQPNFTFSLYWLRSSFAYKYDKVIISVAFEASEQMNDVMVTRVTWITDNAKSLVHNSLTVRFKSIKDINLFGMIQKAIHLFQIVIMFAVVFVNNVKVQNSNF